MPAAHWTITDAEKSVTLDELFLGPEDLVPGCKLVKRTLRGGLRDGVEVVEVDNGLLKFTVLPTRGMGIWRAALGDMQIGWQAPAIGPVHPKFVPLYAPSGLGWLHGFDELLCRCGLESHGAPQFDEQGRLQFPLHGRIANLPAHQVEVSADRATGEVSVTGIVDETRFFGNKLRLRSTVTTRAGSASLKIVDEVTNTSAGVSEMEILYHTNFGHPLLTPQARLVAPIRKLAPNNAHSASRVQAWSTYAEPQVDLPEFCYFMELAADRDERTRVLLETTPGKRGVSMVFNRQQLPMFTVWKNHHAPEDGYVTGLEPGTSLPNVHRYEKEQGRVAMMQPGETRRFELELEVHPDAASLKRATDDIALMQKGVESEIFTGPRPGWTPV